MVVTKHAVKRLHERVTWINPTWTYSFVTNEVSDGNRLFSTIKKGQKQTRFINNGIVYIVDETNPQRLVVITVYLHDEEEWKL